MYLHVKMKKQKDLETSKEIWWILFIFYLELLDCHFLENRSNLLISPVFCMPEEGLRKSECSAGICELDLLTQVS